MAELSETLKNLPELPGVYIMKDSDGIVIYVGKAKVLRNRVRSYFQYREDRDAKTLKLVSNVASIDYIVTHTEEESCFLKIR